MDQFQSSESVPQNHSKGDTDFLDQHENEVSLSEKQDYQELEGREGKKKRPLDYLFHSSGIYDIQGQQFKNRNLYVPLEHCACYQSGSSLYLAEGTDRSIAMRSTKFTLITCKGVRTRLTPLIKRREFLTLAGTESTLLAVGGYDGEYIREVERYHVTTDKWTDFVKLRQEMTTPGVVVLPSLQAYRFCGYLGSQLTNSIEVIKISVDTEWKLLPLQPEVVEINSLVATWFKGDILVFGGQNSLYPMMRFNSEAELVLKYDNLNSKTPGFMYRGCVKHFRGKLYVSGKPLNVETQVLKVFDGTEWQPLQKTKG